MDDVASGDHIPLVMEISFRSTMMVSKRRKWENETEDQEKDSEVERIALN